MLSLLTVLLRWYNEFSEISILKLIRLLIYFRLFYSINFFFLHLVKKSKFRRTTDASKSTGSHDGTGDRRTASEIQCEEAAHPGCHGCEEEETAEFLTTPSAQHDQRPSHHRREGIALLFNP